MPIYEYQCEACEHTFEEYLNVSKRDKPCSDSCPECGENKVTKKVSVTTMGVDANVKTPSWFKERLNKIKSTTPERYHANLDIASDRSGKKLGPQ